MHDPSLQAVRRAAAFESTVLENGLTVRVHTMPGFTGVHAVYGTKFGSIDSPVTVTTRNRKVNTRITSVSAMTISSSHSYSVFTPFAGTIGGLLLTFSISSFSADKAKKGQTYCPFYSVCYSIIEAVP